MTRPFARTLVLVFGAAAALAAQAAAETYSAKPQLPCTATGTCGTPVPSPAGWKCHWSMDLTGKAIKSVLVDGGPGHLDATTCDLKACTAECAKTQGCLAVDVMKPGQIGGQPNPGKCVCTLFGSVASAKQFEEIRLPADKTLSGWACLRLPKRPPPPMRENPNFPGTDRPGFEQDRMRPETPPPTPGSRRP